MPISSGGVGYGGNAHAANEFIVIEGAGKVYGLAGAGEGAGDRALQLRGAELAMRST